MEKGFISYSNSNTFLKITYFQHRYNHQTKHPKFLGKMIESVGQDSILMELDQSIKGIS